MYLRKSVLNLRSPTPLNNSLRFRVLNEKAVMNHRNESYLDDNNLSRKEWRTALY